VQYLDADDLIEPEKIERQINRLIDSPHYVASAEWGRFYDHPSETIFNPESVWNDLSPLDWLALSRANGLGMMLPALWLIPMSIIREVGPWVDALTLNNDAEYFTRIILASSGILFCRGARCHYRSGLQDSLSGRKSPEAWRSQYQVLELCESYVRIREDSERIRRGFSLSWQHLAHSCYPYDSKLSARALARAEALHAVTVKPDGGCAFKIVSSIVGWRVARKLQVLSGRP
jgi:hypothetical protein